MEEKEYSMSEKQKKQKKKAEEQDSKQIVIVNNIPDSGSRIDDIRTINLYSDINEKVCGEAVSALLYLKDTAITLEQEDPEDPESPVVAVSRPINMVVSTFGGSATEMFSVYDTMRMTKEVCDIVTIGMGKVMSAGVLLLAAGTKGRRKIGRNCRVMIHAVAGGSMGGLHSILNEMEQMKGLQDSYIQAISDETELSKKQVQGLINRKVNVYLSAEEAIEKGLADGYM